MQMPFHELPCQNPSMEQGSSWTAVSQAAPGDGFRGGV